MAQVEYESCCETAARAPRIGKRRVSGNAVWRWARCGVKSRSGAWVRLEHVRIGGRVMIPIGALDRFFAAVAEADRKHFDAVSANIVAPTPKPRPPSAARRDKEIAAAEARLTAAGI